MTRKSVVLVVCGMAAAAVLAPTLPGSAAAVPAAAVQPRSASPATTLAVIKEISTTGNYALGVAVNDVDDTVYVTHYASTFMTAIDGASGTVDDTIPLTVDQGNGVAVNQADDSVYVTAGGVFDADNVLVVNGRTNQLAASIGLTNPRYVAVDQSDDTVYATCICDSVPSNDDSVVLVNGRTGVIDDTITVGRKPSGVAVDQGDDTVYIVNEDDGDISVISGGTRVLPDIPVGAAPLQVAVDHDDDTVYVTNSSSDSVSVINGRTRSVVDTIGVGDYPYGVAVDQDDDTVYVTNDDPYSVSVINGRTGIRTDDTITIEAQPYGVAVDDSGTNAGLVYVATSDGSNVGSVSVIGRVTPTIVDVLGAAGASVTLNVDVPQVAYEVDDSTVMSVAFGNNNATGLAATVLDAWTMTVPAGSGTVDVIVTFRGGLKASAGSFTYSSTPTPTPPPPPPAPTYPPGPPTGVQAVAGDDTALVSWTPPTNTGAGPITSYYVYSNPRTGSCTVTPPATSCVMTGLTNGTTYTFQVQAINIDGASSPSAPSNEVTPGVTPPPPPPPTPTITITGARDDKRVTVTGTTTNLTGETVRPWFRFPGQSSFTEGVGVRTVDSAGTFSWSRKTGKKISVYFTHEDIRSNTVTIAAR